MTCAELAIALRKAEQIGYPCQGLPLPKIQQLNVCERVQGGLLGKPHET